MALFQNLQLTAAKISKPKFRVLAELGHSIFQIRTERFILGVLGLLSIRRSDLRKPSHRPVYILPNARREVSSGLRCPRTEAVLLGTPGHFRTSISLNNSSKVITERPL